MWPTNYTVALPLPLVAEAKSSVHNDKLCIRCKVDFDERRLELVLASGRSVNVPFTELQPSGDGTTPNFDEVYIGDYGHSLVLGNYEAAVDALC